MCSEDAAQPQKVCEDTADRRGREGAGGEGRSVEEDEL